MGESLQGFEVRLVCFVRQSKPREVLIGQATSGSSVLSARTANRRRCYCLCIVEPVYAQGDAPACSPQGSANGAVWLAAETCKFAVLGPAVPDNGPEGLGSSQGKPNMSLFA